MSGNPENIELRTPAMGKLFSRERLNAKLEDIHATLRRQVPDIARISVALFDEKSGILKTFVHSSGGDVPLRYYESTLDEAPALREVLLSGKARVVHDMEIFSEGHAEHTEKIRAGGYRSSYTFPLRHAGRFQGFIFFNSKAINCFTEAVLQVVDVYAQLVAQVVMHEVKAVHTLLGALRSANEMVHYRDPETGNHLERMSRFARVIARQLARTGIREFDDEYIENVFLFAPLHDVGKIGIPDRILLKPARLSDAEFRIMETHTTKGREIVSCIVDNFGLDAYENMDILRNITEFHHETLDGAGYPLGLKGDEIPMEARIVAVADVFDALTSVRPYKRAWSNQEAVAFLHGIAGEKLDRDCVTALEQSLDEIEEIQRRFGEDPDSAESGRSE